jgi:hypothetical protein
MLCPDLWRVQRVVLRETEARSKEAALVQGICAIEVDELGLLVVFRAAAQLHTLRPDDHDLPCSERVRMGRWNPPREQ